MADIDDDVKLIEKLLAVEDEDDGIHGYSKVSRNPEGKAAAHRISELVEEVVGLREHDTEATKAYLNLRKLYKNARAAALEEAAKVVEKMAYHWGTNPASVAAAIRALPPKPDGGE